MTERCVPDELLPEAAGAAHRLQTVNPPVAEQEDGGGPVPEVPVDLMPRKQAEESLAKQLSLIRTITDNSTQALLLVDQNGLCTLINRAAESMFGWSLAGLRARPLHEMIHHRYPDGRPYPLSECVLNRALAESRPLRDHEDVFIRRNGEPFPVLVAASPIVEQGRPVATVLEVRDITEQVRGKQALARMSHQLRLILRSAGEGIYGLDLDGRAAFINPAGAAMFGYGEEELLGQNLHSLFHHSHADGRSYAAEDCPIYAVLRDGRPRAGEDQTFWTKSGAPLAVAYTCSPMLDGDRVIGAVVVVRDITERQRVQQALRESEERLRLALASGQMGAWDVDLVSGETQWDAKECSLLGVAEQLVPDGRLFYDRVHPDDRPAVRRRVQAAIETGELQHEFRIIQPDGQVRWLASRGLVLKDQTSRPRRMVGINFDVTERKQMEERLRSFTLELEWRVAERTQELQDSQERLRALATELNLTEQRERKRLATDLHDYLAQLLVLIRLKLGQLKRVASGAETPAIIQAMEEVVNEALAYTRTLVTQLSPPVLHEFGLPAALQWLSRQMLRQELSVTVTQLVPDQLALPEEQAVLLFQSVRELLLNVKKHAQTHEAMVTIEQHERELRLTVRDCGVGVMPATPTGEAPSPTLSSKFGLFSIRERMRAIGGRLEFESLMGRGTRATLVLPLGEGAADTSCARRRVGGTGGEATGVRGGEEASDGKGVSDSPSDITSEPDDASPVKPHPSSPGVSDASTMRVLLVDDHLMIREGLRGLLKQYTDVEVVGEAWDGEEAVSSADRLRPDVVLMDINMPRMDGIEATRRIKAAFRSIAVIGLSVNAAPEVAKAMTTSGADAFLSKEAAGEQIYQTMSEIVASIRG